ncbi:hypothetical protein ASE09_32150 [Streptomyces sp. Root66D1]|nr:hypothetical protein ASD33_32365 [Streptomyces sp. Root1304]KRA93598.1 hypothetical protein ASE09_32150 [Streptomyces sp. Root66D1]
MESRRLHGVLGTAVGLALALPAAMLLGRAWNACDVGVNNAANSGFLLWLFVPGLWTILLLVWVVVGALLRGRPVLHAVALAVTLIGVVWCAISLFWEGAATPPCPGGVPPWWPSLIPAPGL